VEEVSKRTTENVGRLEQRVEKISSQQDKVGKMDKKFEQSENRIFEEMMERESKRLKIVMHNVEEAGGGE
jgi:hypothetical protein